MADELKGKADYAVGYGKPPKEHRFRKGRSGNPAGAPKKKNRKPVDVSAVLNEPVLVRKSGVLRKVQPFEISVRQLVERGLKQEDLKAILEILDLCRAYKVLTPPEITPDGGVIRAPKGVNFYEWLESVTELVPVSTPNDEFD